jgi:hypothetical protein
VGVGEVLRRWYTKSCGVCVCGNECLSMGANSSVYKRLKKKKKKPTTNEGKNNGSVKED